MLLGPALIVGLPWALLVHRFWFVCDDAYIALRYARNLALGRGLTFDPGDPAPVEGFSDLGWMGLAAVCERLGWRADRIMPWVAAAAAAGALILTVRVARERLGVGAPAAIGAGLVLGLVPAFAVWSSSGLETSTVALLVLALVDAWALGRARTPRDERLGALAAAALVVVRVDGWLWALGIAVAAGIGAAWDREEPPVHALGRLARSAAPAIGAAVAIEVWRRLTFGVWVPHTAAVKAAVDAASLARGARYVGAWVADGPTPALVAVCAASGCVGARIGRGRAVALVLACGVAPALAIAASGDFLPFWRLLVPALPVGALVVAAGLDAVGARAGTVGVAIVAGIAAITGLGSAFGVDPVADALRPVLAFRVVEPGLTDPSERARWQQTAANAREFAARGRALAQIARPGDAVVSVGVGALAYFADTLVVLDRCGLVNREVGLRAVPPGGPPRSPGHDKLVPAEFFVDRDPRFLHARVVDGPDAPDEMDALLAQWAVRDDVRDRYLPDWYAGGKQRLLFVVRRAEPGEDALSAWAGFDARLDRLGARIRAGQASP